MRFEVKINGKKICMAGIDEYGVLSAIVSWVLRDPAKHDKNKHPDLEEYMREELEVSLGGLTRRGHHVEWIKKPLQINDEIKIKILGPGDFDPPQNESK